jgi:glycosyltransferase involved in cell wall biosynthesis
MLNTLIQGNKELNYLLGGENFERLSNPHETFSIAFIKNMLASVDIYIDLSPKEGLYIFLASIYHNDLNIVANELEGAYFESLQKITKTLGFKNIAVQFGRHELNEIIGQLDNGKLCQKSLLIRALIEGDGTEELKVINQVISGIEKTKLIIEISQKSINSKLIDLRNILEKVINKGFVVWALDDSSKKFLRIKFEDGIGGIPTLSNYIFYCVKQSESLSISFFSHSPGLGGSEKMMFELAESLVKDFGAVCTVVVPRPGPQSEAHKRIGVATIYAFPHFLDYGWWCDDAGKERLEEDKQVYVFARSKAIEMNVLENLRTFDPDIIWTQSMVIPWGAKVAETLNKPHIWYVTEFGEQDFGFKFFSPFSEILEEIESTSNLVYTCSQVLKDTLFPLAHNEKVSVLYSCIPEPSINVLPNINQYFKEENSIKFGMFSQIRPTKGQEDAVLAIAQCVKNGLNIELVIAGGADHTYLKYLIALTKDLGIEKNINFSGYADNPFGLMSLCDVVIMSSRLEAFGRVGVEAMLLNKPVIFANTGGISEYQVDGQTGLSYPPGDVNALSKQIELLYGDMTLRKKMGSTGKQHAKNIFSKKNFSERVYFELKKIAEAGRDNCRAPRSIEAIIKDALESLKSEGRYKKFVSRNEPCPCNSGKRYKHCCGMVA